MCALLIILLFLSKIIPMLSYMFHLLNAFLIFNTRALILIGHSTTFYVKFRFNLSIIILFSIDTCDS